MQVAELSTEFTAEQLRRCPRCEEPLPLSEFGVCRARKDGLNLYCKGCIRQKIQIARISYREYKATVKARADAQNISVKDAERLERQSREMVGAFGPAEREKLPPLSSLPPQVQRFAREAVKIFPHEDRLLRSIRRFGPQTFEQLRQTCRVEIDALSQALANLIGRREPLLSRNGTGPRKYFLNPAFGRIQSEVSVLRRTTAVEPALSFTTLNLPTRPVMKGKR